MIKTHIMQQYYNRLSKHLRLPDFNFEIPDEYKSEYICMVMIDKIKFYEYEMHYIDEFITNKNNTIELWIKICIKNTNYHIITPDEFKIEYFYSEVYKKNKPIYRFLPDYLKTEENSKEIFDIDIKYIKYIPKKYITNEYIKKIIKSNLNNTDVISYIPKKFITKDITEIIIKKFNRYQINNIYKKINFKILNNDFLIKYVDKLCCSFKYFSEDMFTKELIILYILYNPSNIKIIPEKFKTKDFYIEIITKIERDFEVIQHIPDNIFTQELCNIVFKKDNKSFKYIHDKFKTRDMQLQACLKYPEYIQYIKEELKSDLSFQNDLDYYEQKNIPFIKSPTRYTVNRRFCDIMLKFN